MDLKRFERGWRAMWMHAIGRALPGPRRVDSSRFDARPLRTLFVRYERIGDMILATGLIRVLAEASTSGSVDVVANPTTAPVLEGNPHVGRVFTLDRKSRGSYLTLMRQLRAARYDVIVDGRINNPAVFTSTPMLMLAARASYRVGVGGGNNDLIYNVPVQRYDRATPYVEGSKALSVPFHVDSTAVDWQPEIFLSQGEREAAETHWRKAVDMVSHDGASPAEACRAKASRNDVGGESAGALTRRLLVNLSASEAKRRWADANFVEVLKEIRAMAPALPMIVIGLPAEWSSVAKVAQSINAWATPTPRLRDALAVVGTSDMVVTPDTSISHAASAFRKPAVVLLKRDHHPYAPYNIPGEIVFWDGDQIHGLPVAGVRDAVRRLVDRYGGLGLPEPRTRVN